MHAEAITRALGGRWHGRYGTCRCPAHEDRTPSLSVTDGNDGRLLVRCFAGCDGRDILAALRHLGLDNGRPRVDPEEEARRVAREQEDAARRTRQALACWAEAGPAADTLAERYLRARAYTGPVPMALRFQPDCWHQSARHLPAMVAAVQLGADIVAVHRTYLGEPGRKADVDPVKACLGPVKGGAVRLSSGVGPLIVAEGIETALTLLDELRDLAPRVWSAVSAPGMETLCLPARAGELVIAPDPDERGRSAAETLAARAYNLGWRVRVMRPPKNGDWNDVAREVAA